jgi:hypothetical protein
MECLPVMDKSEIINPKSEITYPKPTFRGIMKRLILPLLFFASFAVTAMAQVAQPAWGPITGAPILLPGDVMLPSGARIDIPNMLTPTNVNIGYCDLQISMLLWRIPSNYQVDASTVYQSVNISQRFTLPTADGFLDSMWIFVRELPIGRIRIDVLKDAVRKLAQDTTKLVHYPDYWATTASPVLDSAKLSSTQFFSEGFTRIDFRHTLVPKDYHVVVAPQIDSLLTPAFSLISDSRKGTLPTLTIDNSRSTMMLRIIVNNQTQAYVPIHMRGFFTDQQQNALAPEFYIVSFLEVDMPSGTQTVAVSSSPELFQNYPNPFFSGPKLTEIRFELKERGFTTLDVYDAMGRKVQTLENSDLDPGSHMRVFNAGNLSCGTYYYRLVQGGRQLTRSMLYVK